MFNLTTFRELITAALWTGLLAGLLLTAVQQIQVIPTLLQAEVYEENAAAAVAANPENSHEHHEWQPENGWQRTFFTAVANISLGVGFALLIGSVMCLRGRPSSWRIGLLWGLAGYLTFFVAPSLGLPPEVPGTETAKLADRQSWWLITVLDTGFGLSLLAFAKTRTNKFFGAALLAAPHLISAPQPEIHSSAAPAELAQSFIVATVFANAVFWLAIGGLMGQFYKKGS
ncbi:MAG: CbtA family protein [Methylobacter sp.]|jgi:cobalt transporter subunit CbtA|nr:CbtA family protein [Methylobacter sp.]